MNEWMSEWVSKWKMNARINAWTWELDCLHRWRKWNCTKGEQCITKKRREIRRWKRVRNNRRGEKSEVEKKNTKIRNWDVKWIEMKRNGKGRKRKVNMCAMWMKLIRIFYCLLILRQIMLVNWYVERWNILTQTIEKNQILVENVFKSFFERGSCKQDYST